MAHKEALNACESVEPALNHVNSGNLQMLQPPIADYQFAANSADVKSKDPNRNLNCDLHGAKPRALFCFDCRKAICGDCVGQQGQGHDLHHVDNLAIVYREKATEIEAMLAKAETLIDRFMADSGCYEKNLEELDREQGRSLRGIETVAESSKLQLWLSTSKRKAAIKDRMKIPLEKAKVLADLRGMVKQLSTEEFLQQCSEIDRKCNDLMSGCDSTNVIWENLEDTQCDLIPNYRFGEIVFPGFVTTETGQSFSCTLTSNYDVLWKLTLKKLQMVQVQLDSDDLDIVAIPHKLRVIIPHSDCTKRIHKTFDVGGSNSTLNIATTSDLMELCVGGNLVIRFGIRPLDIVAENRLLAHRYEQSKIQGSKIRQQLQSIVSGVDHKHCTSHHLIRLWDLPKMPFWDSSCISDQNGRFWLLAVQFVPLAQYNNGILNVRIVLFRGSCTGSSFFVELVHVNPEKTIAQAKTAFFQQGQSSGWDNFVTWSTLVSEKGFHPNGVVCFRFGVKPLPPKEF